MLRRLGWNPGVSSRSALLNPRPMAGNLSGCVGSLVILAALIWCVPTRLFAAKSKAPVAKTPAEAIAAFAPLPADHPLAEIWNDPDFVKRLFGSYGTLSEQEPKLTAEEQAFYRDTVVPLVRDDPAKAIKELEARLKPGGSAAFDYTLGNLFFQTDDLTNAVKFFEQAVEKFPDYRRAQKNLGFALVRSGQFDAAVKPLSRTLSLGGADGKVFGLLGYAHMNLGRHLSAESAYRQALLYEPDSVDFKLGVVKCQIALSEYDAALAMLDELIGQFPGREALWALQANVYIQKEQPAKAAMNFEILRRMDKATAAQLGVLGDLYLSQDAKDLALGAYQEALAKDPATGLKRALRAAELLVGRGAFDEAKQLFAKIRSADGSELAGPEGQKLLKLEAKVALASGDADAAIATLEKVVEQNPLDGEALLLAGDYYARHDQKEKAAFRYETAAKISGFEADGLLKQAQLQVEGRKYVEAVELLRKAQKIKPRDNVGRYLEKVEQLARGGRA
jgi:tetratricopeptide (TPR) repeat protein